MGVYVALFLLGLGAGAASSLLGIGGGVILVPVFTFIFAKEWIPLPGGVATIDAIKVATVTSLAYIVPVALTGALRSESPIQWKIILLAVPGGLIGAYLGAMAKDHVSAAHLKVAFACLMFLAGARLGLKGLREMRATPQPAEVLAVESAPTEEP